MSERPHHRPALPGRLAFEAVEGGPDPAQLREAAEQSAVALVRGTTEAATDDLVARVVALAETEGLDALAELWSGSPADSVAGSLWRLYLLRTWVHADPVRASTEFAAGRTATPVAEVVAGVADPPGPEEVRRLVDDVLAGVVRGEYADVLFRAAAFARVAAAGRTGADHAGDLSAARLLTLSQQLEQAGRLELADRL
ncbi:hypothetical protein D9V37_11525 [Nocardioides mangrovicus]|uniref:DNA-directed RNA polymerase subunit beta n=1 Tax=Nocardioides mangrovicus TaxID=2478913 RepID=A0A3L8P161_9ACTN|nr:hypothetical protein [Nocardioides mangrovicus]RLV49180.1 hypothetical protein D9V37_11525 [Nocardioides mangrovicus]